MNDYTIAPPRRDQLPALMAIERRAALMFPADHLPAGMKEECVPLESLLNAAGENRLWAALAADTGEPVGFALLEEFAGAAVLAELDVLPEHGRKGVGRALVRTVAQAAAERGRRFLHLTTFADLPWNAPFYEKLGFIPLAPPHIPEPVAAILADELRLGFRNRLAMRLELPGAF